MKDRIWNLLIAMFVIIASQAVLLVGIFMGGAVAGGMGIAAIGGGLIGIMAGIIMGIFAIFGSKKSGALAD